MNADLDQFTRQLDQLLGICPEKAPLSSPALQAASSLTAVDLESEVSPRSGLRERWISQARRQVLSTSTRKGFIQALRARPALALFLLLLSLALITGVAYALGRLTGFIPGFGFTSDGGPVHVLAQAVESTAGGVTLQVNQAVDDGERFWVELTASGLSEAPDFSNAFVLLPGGEKMQFQSGASSDLAGDELRLSYLFPQLSTHPEELTLLVEGLGGQDFSLLLKMRPVETGEIIPMQPAGSAQLQSESIQGMRLVLDHVAVDSKKTVFQVSLRFDQPNTWLTAPWNVTLSDEDGNLYPLTNITPDTLAGGDIQVYQTLPFSGSEQLTLRLVSFPSGEALPLFIDLSSDSPTFTIELGTNPEIGQTWEINKVLTAGGFSFRVLNATLTGEPGLLFEIEPEPPLTGVMFHSTNPLMTGAAGGVPVHSGNLSSSITFSEIPEGALEVRLMSVYYQAAGNWQIHWQPPPAPPAAVEAPMPAATASRIPLSTPTLALSNPLLLEVQQLAQQFDAPLQQGPGWVHVVQETITNPQRGQTFPPPYIRSETWYEIDPEGYVARYVSLDFGDRGEILQQSATVGDYSVNFTTGDSGFNNSSRYRLSLDILSHELSTAGQYSMYTHREQSSCDDGRPCLLYTLLDNFAASRQNPGEPQAFSGSGRRTWVDPQTGQQTKTQVFWLLEDGSERITYTTATTLVEKASAPPENILTILSRVVIP